MSVPDPYGLVPEGTAGYWQNLECPETYNPESIAQEPELTSVFGENTMVNVQNAGEIYRCGICGNVVMVQEAGGGELVCHGEPMKLVEDQENVVG